LKCDEDNQERTAIVIPIHGTWAKGASWTIAGTKDGDRFQNSVRRNIREKVKFTKPFEWSGANQWLDREKGSKDLITYIKKQVKYNKSAAIFLVAHSHAGNLIRSALATDPELSSMISGVVCMATPFLSAKKRDFSIRLMSSLPYLMYFFILCGAVLLFLAWPFLFNLDMQGFESVGVTALEVVTLGLIKGGWVIVVIGGLIFMGLALSNDSYRRINDLAEKSIDKLAPWENVLDSDLPTLNIWVSFDEAFFPIRFVQMLLLIPSTFIKILMVIAGILMPLLLLFLTLSGLGYIVVFLVNIGSFFSDVNEGLSVMVTYSNWAAGYIEPVIECFSYAAIGAVFLHISLHVFSFLFRKVATGSEHEALSYGLISIGVSKTLEGADVMVPKIGWLNWIRFRLRHSVIWQDESCLEDVSTWISTQIN